MNAAATLSRPIFPTPSRTSLYDFRTTVPLHDLGNLQPEFAGIYSPIYDRKLVESYIHKQFLEDSAQYVRKYQNVPHWKYLLGTAKPFMPANTNDVLKILDIGSGAGNTVFALFDLYPKAKIIASDLSVPLLKALKDLQEEQYGKNRCLIMQLNVEELIFEANQFDLVVGGSILHHLFDPEKTVTQCCNVLKQGGAAVFFEPFELGNQILALVFRQLIHLSEYHPEAPLDPRIVKFFQALCIDYRYRLGTSKPKERFLHIDDKWLFVKTQLEAMAQRAGFRDVNIYSIHNSTALFKNQIGSLLKIGLDMDLGALPKWAADYVVDMDNHFSIEQRDELYIEAGVVFIK